MNVIISRTLLALIITGFVMTLSCGRSKESKETSDQAAQKADSALSAAITSAPFKDILDEAGYEIIAVKEFPSAITRRSGQAVVYRSTAKDRSGGVLYFASERKRSFPTWHWFFDDDAPDDVQAVELNADGLWDVRITMGDGTVREFLQDEDFTLFAEMRSDWIALNVRSSPATDPDHPVWQCLDGQTNTAWRSSLQASGEVDMELWAPFGISRGILTIQTVDEGRPRECELFADGKPVKKFTLEDRAGEQRVQLNKTFDKGSSIRLVVRSSYGEGGNIAIAEFRLE
jgi:hypothetical protein